MTTASSDTLVTLRERRRQLADRLEELKAQARDITDDIAGARQDWVDSVELGEDSTLLAQRVHLRESELTDNQRAADHLRGLVADLDRQIADIETRRQLAEEVQRFNEARIDYNADLPEVPDALPTAVTSVKAALDCLLGEVADARDTHDRLAGTAAQLRQRAELLGVDVVAPDPADWSAGLNRIDKDGPLRQLALAVMQRRGPHAVLAEIERVILLGLNDQRRAAR
jgi:chromosome segregation ATPase